MELEQKIWNRLVKKGLGMHDIYSHIARRESENLKAGILPRNCKKYRGKKQRYNVQY
jgi:hypothetical protein